MGLVSKEKMLEKLGQFHPDYMFNIASIRNFIKAQPEVEKKGKWIDNDSAEWYCSECGAQAPFFWMSEIQRKSNYCYNCGADMRGEEE